MRIIKLLFTLAGTVYLSAGGIECTLDLLLDRLQDGLDGWRRGEDTCHDRRSALIDLLGIAGGGRCQVRCTGVVCGLEASHDGLGELRLALADELGEEGLHGFVLVDGTISGLGIDRSGGAVDSIGEGRRLAVDLVTGKGNE